MKNIVTAKWVDEHMEDKKIIIMDCRGDLLDPKDGFKKYEQGHIPGAYFLETKKYLSGPVGKHGGRNPLPKIEILQRKLEDVGVAEDTTIIAYDDNKLFLAARLWWQLKYLGHEKVYILNGGISKWIEEGYPLSKEVPKNKNNGNMTIAINESMKIDAKNIREKEKNKSFILLDARTEERYLGKVELVDKIAGHIPGAKLYPAEDNLKENGEWNEKDIQEQRFAEIKRYQDIVLYCGSGINACLNFIALDELGIKPKLYVGSWSDWITYEGYPVAQKRDGRL